MSAGLKRIDGLGGHGSRFFRASVKSALWLPLRLPIRYQKGLNPPLLATRIRRKYLALSAGYELLSKLQNLYAPVRSRPAPPISFNNLASLTGEDERAAVGTFVGATCIFTLFLPHSRAARCGLPIRFLFGHLLLLGRLSPGNSRLEYGASFFVSVLLRRFFMALAEHHVTVNTCLCPVIKEPGCRGVI